MGPQKVADQQKAINQLEDIDDVESDMDLDDQDKKQYSKNLRNFDQNLALDELKKLKKDLVLQQKNKIGQPYTEVIQNFDISEFLNEEKDIIFSELLQQLQDMGFPIQGTLCYYWLPDDGLYVYCGVDPLPEDIKIHHDQFYELPQLRIQCAENPVPIIHQIMSEENAQNGKTRDGIQDNQSNSQCRRTKERKIGYIIEQVVQWRKFYNGFMDETGKQVKLSLEEAANKVSISKKSLDDYLLQIRFGRKYGFNFNEHQNEKVGVLRSFVQQNKPEKTHNENAGPKKPRAQTKKQKDVQTQINNDDDDI